MFAPWLITNHWWHFTRDNSTFSGPVTIRQLSIHGYWSEFVMTGCLSWRQPAVHPWVLERVCDDRMPFLASTSCPSMGIGGSLWWPDAFPGVNQLSIHGYWSEFVMTGCLSWRQPAVHPWVLERVCDDRMHFLVLNFYNVCNQLFLCVSCKLVVWQGQHE